MKHKSITFRCSDKQMKRIQTAMSVWECDNRSTVLSTALEEFLRFTEQADIAGMSLFELVNRINEEGSGRDFASQA